MDEQMATIETKPCAVTVDSKVCGQVAVGAITATLGSYLNMPEQSLEIPLCERHIGLIRDPKLVFSTGTDANPH